MAKVFQVQAKDSIVALGPFVTVNAVQNLNLDPNFNEENFSELGNEDFSGQARSPETSGSFEVTGTGSLPSVLARMIYDFDLQEYLFDPLVAGNVYTITETDFENAIFDVINLKKPGETFKDSTLVPYAQLTGLTIRVDAAGTATESYTFEADRQEEYATPFHDITAVTLQTQDADTARVNSTDFPTINSGTYGIVAVFKDGEKFGDAVSSWATDVDIDVTGANFTQAAPFDRVVAILYRYAAGSFPTVHYPTSARFMRGDRVDIWLVDSGVSSGSLNDTNRLLRCQSADINVDLTRDRLQEIRRNPDQSTTFFRGLNFPLEMQVNVNILENELDQWADLQNKTINEGADPFAGIVASNVMNLADFVDQKVVIKYYPPGAASGGEVCTVEMNNLRINAFSERQQVQGRAERTLGFIGSNISIVGVNG